MGNERQKKEGEKSRKGAKGERRGEKEKKNGKWRGEMRFAVSFINHTERDLTAL